MQRVITYLYPIEEKASNLKVFQDKTSQIRGFYFTRDNICEVERLEFANNYAVYFLFDESLDTDLVSVYVGQSKNGVNRMKDHNKTKSFWTYCVMFVTDNNSFDASTIDYMEYYFINKLRNSTGYSLENKDQRTREPIVSIYDKPIINSYVKMIEFLLKAEGIELEERVLTSNVKYYYPKSTNYKGKIFVEDGKFILVAGSELRYPIETSKGWSDQGAFYNRFTGIMDKLLKDGRIEKVNGAYVAKKNMIFSNPSRLASLMSGRSENGWIFFEGLDEVRN